MRLARTALLLAAGLALPALAGEAETFTVDKSQAETRFTLDAPLDSIIGISPALAGSIRYDPEGGSGNGKITADLSSFRTGISLRDEDLRNEFFQAPKFPVATLNLQRIERKKPAPGPGEWESSEAIGTLSLHGVEKVVRIPIKLRYLTLVDHAVIQAQGSFSVKLAEYQIQRPTALFLKLGDTAKVDVQLTFAGPLHAPAAGAAPATSQAAPAAPPSIRRTVFIPVAKLATHKPPKAHARFSPATPEGRGEKLFTEAAVGGPGNAVSCAACHGTTDERGALAAEPFGIVHPGHSLFDAAKRPAFWQGLEPTPGRAASLCSRLFQLAPTGLSDKQQTDLEAYLKALSPDDAVAALDYRVLALTRRSDLLNPIGGDAKLGAKLHKKFCESCHNKGAVRPPLTPGLYEPDYLVRRVRWLTGHDARQMPPISAERLTDTDLRNIVTYLAGKQAKRIFDRKQHAPPAQPPQGEPTKEAAQ
jgi:polyisoprenoid-binding protein YceI/mono/diheme cytochrome c family protein